MKNLINNFVCFVVICNLTTCIFGDQTRVLLGSPVSKNPDVLKNFLDGLQHIKHDNFSLDCIFIDDNYFQQSSDYLKFFEQKTQNCTIIKSWVKIPPHGTHKWDLEVIRKVANFKDFIIERAIEGNYDYLFLIDSDLLLNPNTIKHLITCNKDIISEIFWTSCKPGSSNKWGNVWSKNEYDLTPGFLNILKNPGIYKVGGLGACTLISRHALLMGVKFKELKNFTFYGEDRHFCVRATALGLTLYVDTHYPAYHMYFDCDLDGTEQFKRKNNYYKE